MTIDVGNKYKIDEEIQKIRQTNRLNLKKTCF
jgi:hypothetical protein